MANIWNLWNIEQTVSQRILNLIIKEEMDQIDFLKCKLGLESFVINITKFLIVYTAALLFKVAIPTSIFHASFLLIRTFSYGRHAKTSLGCVSSSLLLFVGLPVLCQSGILIPTYLLFYIRLLSLVVLLKFSPGVTDKNKLSKSNRKKALRVKSIISWGVLNGLYLITASALTENLIVLGMFFASMYVIPNKFKGVDKL